MEIEFAARSEKGPVRNENQDRYILSDFRTQKPFLPACHGLFSLEKRGVLLAIADGMGGGPGGQEAATLCLSALLAELLEREKDWDPARGMVVAIEKADAVLHERGKKDPTLEGMGTTLTAALIQEGHLWIGHVGDTRAYLGRTKNFTLLTSDHTVLQKVVGQNNAKDASHPYKSVLAQCVGGRYQEVFVEVTRLDLCRNDTLLLCSDGVHGVVQEEDIHRALSSENLEGACQTLLDLALHRHTQDNVTVLLARFRGENLPAASPSEIRPERLKQVTFDSAKGILHE